MKSVIEILKNKRTQIIAQLKEDNDPKKYLADKLELDKAIEWLEKVDDLKLSKVSEYDFVKLPDMKADYSDYRIMDDCEVDHRDMWIEVEISEKISAGDLIIVDKK